MNYGRITGSGSYLPERVMTNADLMQLVDTTAEWIVERTGVQERHIAADGETTCDLAEKAARRAIEAAGIKARDIDLIVVGTTTPDKVFPSTACLLQQRLKNHNCPAFDVQAVCTGFIYGLDIANRFIQTGGARRALVVGAETLSRIIDWSDRSTCLLFGDGAGAVVLEASDRPGILSSHLHADGSYESLLNVPSGISHGYDKVRNGEAFLQMKGNEVFKIAVNTLGSIAEEVLAANGLRAEEIDWLVPHQANIRIITATARKLNMSLDQVVVTVDKHGNTSAASVPMALDTAIRDGRIKPGDTLLLEAFGGGFTWGAALIQY